jgi:hypothetical protein
MQKVPEVEQAETTARGAGDVVESITDQVRELTCALNFLVVALLGEDECPPEKADEPLEGAALLPRLEWVEQRVTQAHAVTRFVLRRL